MIEALMRHVEGVLHANPLHVHLDVRLEGRVNIVAHKRKDLLRLQHDLYSHSTVYRLKKSSSQLMACV
eukprot:4597814-Amphidinium_carterae.1